MQNGSLKSCNNMNFIKQKQRESEGEFQTFNLQVYTINQPIPQQYKSHLKRHPRATALPQKHKLGLIDHPILTQPQHVAAGNNSFLVPNGKVINIGSATFRSNFESGSIGSVDIVGSNSYEIGLEQQTNSSRSNIWFYFAVQGVKGEASFKIKGFSKKSSLYNEGMKMCYRDNKQSNKWRRGGLKISYEAYTQDYEQNRFYCLKFSYFFKSSQFSSVQFAYSFPYGANKLNYLLANMQPKIKVQTLGQSYEGRAIPIVTLGNPKSKEIIMVSARVHPGQTGSSFIVQGFLKQIINDSQHSTFLRDHFLIKIIPMINVDGVARGNYRFSASGADLNRKWKQPHQRLHPQICLLKKMILKENKQRKIRIYIDLHGHSRKKNVFFYGCCPKNQPNSFSKAKAFPFLMSKLNNSFDYQSCSFTMQKDKQGTARITLFKELKIYQIFTLQASFCGLANGPNFSELDYQKLGRKLCEGLSLYFIDSTTTNVKSLQKLLALKRQIINQLQSNSFYLNYGNQEDVGSDSEPEKGEAKLSPVKFSNQKFERKSQQNKHNQRKISRNFQALKHKSQYLSQQVKSSKDQQPQINLFQPPAHTLDTYFDRNQGFSANNQRVHSIMKQVSVKTKVFNLSEEIAYNEAGLQRQFQRIKVNLLIGKEGAQYRRVRKIAEQGTKLQKSQTDFFSVKGVRGSKIQLGNGIKMMPKLSLSQNKHRKTSAQMYLRKPLRLEQQIDRKNMKVLCRGRQIFF